MNFINYYAIIRVIYLSIISVYVKKYVDNFYVLLSKGKEISIIGFLFLLDPYCFELIRFV